MLGRRRMRPAPAQAGKRNIEGAIEVIVGAQEVLDSPPQLGIARALGVEYGGAVGRRLAFHSRQEHGLYAIRIGRHQMTFRLRPLVPLRLMTQAVILSGGMIRRRGGCHGARPWRRFTRGVRGRR